MCKSTLLPLTLALAAAPHIAAQTLLVVNQGNSTVSLVDVATSNQIAVIAENTPHMHGHEIVATPDGRTAFLPIYGSVGVGQPGLDGDEILVIDIPSRKIIDHIRFSHGVRPHQPVFDPVSGNLYVTTELDQAITIIDPKTYKIIGSIPTGQPESHMLAISHDGNRGYTANVGPGTVSVLDMHARKTLAIVPISSNTQRISISNDDKRVFTSDQTAPRLAVIDTSTNRVSHWVTLPAPGYGTASTPDGHSLLVAVPSTHQVAVVDLHTLRVTRTLDVPAAPQEILISPDGHRAYISCNETGHVAVLDLATFTLAPSIKAGPGCDGLAWAR